MAVDTATHISGLNVLLPTGSDNRKEADNNFRHIKTVLATDFPNIGGPVTATHTELNYVDGVTSAIQGQLDEKGAIAGQTWTGTHDYTAATVTVATPSSNSQAANKVYVDSVAFSSALPAITTSTAGKVITNNGTTASWQDAPLVTAESFFLVQL